MKGKMIRKSSLARRSLDALDQYESLKQFEQLTKLGEQASNDWNEYWDSSQ